MTDVGSMASAVGLLSLVGLLLIVIGAVLVWVNRGKQIHATVAVIVVGLVLVFLGIFIGALPSAPATVAPPVAGAQVSTTVLSAGLPSGTTWNSQTNTLTVDLVANYTHGAATFCISKTNTTFLTKGSCQSYFVLPIHSARVDSLNETAGFTYSIGSIPTFASNNTEYSFLGYTTGTSAQWSAQWSEGSIAKTTCSQSAPSVTTNVCSDIVGIASFGSTTNSLTADLAGGNSTGSPYVVPSLYTPFSMTVDISGSTPAVLTVDFTLIGIQT